MSEACRLMGVEISGAGRVPRSRRLGPPRSSPAAGRTEVSSASEPDQLVGPGIVPMPSIAFVNSIA